MPDTHVMTLRDGRDLGWLEVGDPDGVAVLCFHGTPGSRLMVRASGDDARRSGARLICPDRPGYGLSTYVPDRRFADWPDDVAELTTHLGIDRWCVMGVSGGGPHAAVCAAALDGVAAAAIVSGVAPLAVPGAVDAMSRANRVMAAMAARRSPAVRAILAAQLAVSRRWPQFAIDQYAKSLPPSDRAVLARDEVRAIFSLEVSRGPRSAARAAAQDLELFSADWGFSLSDVAVATDVWQGDADTIVPPRHAAILCDAIPGAELHVVPGEGHFMVLDRVAEILSVLVTRASA